MPRVDQPSGGVYSMGERSPSKGILDLSSPAGWTMLWWFLSIAVILLIWFSL